MSSHLEMHKAVEIYAKKHRTNEWCRVTEHESDSIGATKPMLFRTAY